MGTIDFATAWGQTHLVTSHRPWLQTLPEVHDSSPVPLGYEAAPKGPRECRGWCERQGRGDCAERCGFVPTSTPAEVIDSNLAGLGIAELAEQQMRPALRAATWAVAGAGIALAGGVVGFLAWPVLMRWMGA